MRTLCLPVVITILTLTTPLAAESRIRLLGTVEAGEDSRALIETQNKGSEIFCALSRECRRDGCACQIEDATILSIGHEHIWLRAAGRRMKIVTGQSILAPPAAPGTMEAQPALTAETRTEFAPNVRILLRELERARWTTVFEHEGSARERLQAVLQPLGLRAGDKIQKVQGHSFDPTAWTPLAALKEAQEIKIEIERGGRPLVFKIQIKD